MASMTVHPQPLRVINGEGIGLEELQEMLVRSAPLTHEWANRRWKNWIFKVNLPSMEVHRMASFSTYEEGGGRDFMFEECEDCEGEGCSECGWHGQVKRRLQLDNASNFR